MYVSNVKIAVLSRMGGQSTPMFQRRSGQRMLEFPWWAWIIMAFEAILVVLLFTKWKEPMMEPLVESKGGKVEDGSE